MDERRQRILTRVALGLTLAWVAWTLYDSTLFESNPQGRELAAAGRYLEDGELEKALAAFSGVYRRDPENIGALRGQALAAMQLGIRQLFEARKLKREGDEQRAAKRYGAAQKQLNSARTWYDESIRREQARGVTETNRRALGVAYANRGILKDQLGDYRGALRDYQQALKLEPKVAEGPGLLTRFLRNQSKRPPSVADRARYLRDQLDKPAQERLMRIPDEDARQRAYKLE